MLICVCAIAEPNVCDNCSKNKLLKPTKRFNYHAWAHESIQFDLVLRNQLRLKQLNELKQIKDEK